VGGSAYGWQEQTIFVESTQPFTTLNVRTGGAHDVVGVGGVAAQSRVGIWTGDGDDGILVGSPQPNIYLCTLSPIRGAVDVDGGPGANELTVNDRLADRGQVYNVGVTGEDAAHRWSRVTCSSCAPVTWRHARLHLLTSDGNDVINVAATAAYEPVIVQAGAGHDAVTLGGSGKVLDGITSALVLDGEDGDDTLTLNDQNANGTRSYEVFADRITHGGLGAVEYGAFESVVLNATDGGSTPIVYGTALTTALSINTGRGENRTQVGGCYGETACTLDTIGGPVSVNGQGKDALYVLDINPPAAWNRSIDDYTISDTAVARAAKSARQGEKLVLLQQIDELVVRLGSPVHVSVQSTAAGTPLKLFCDRGDDTICVAGGLKSTATIHAGAGNDRLEITGSAGADTATLRPGSLDLVAAGYEVHGDGAETIRLLGSRGLDKATLYDSEGDDEFVAYPASARLSGAGFDNQVESFALVVAHSSGQEGDAARLYDSAGDDTLTASPTSARLSGEGFDNRAESFRATYAYASAGGRDVAQLQGSAGKDKIKFQQAACWMYGAAYYNRAKFFDEVYADGKGGTSDTAIFYDNAGTDVLAADPNATTVTTGPQIRRATSFENVTAYGSPADTATLSDSPGNDIFDGLAHKSRLYSTGAYQITARGYKTVTAVASTGFDKARLYDTVFDDTYECRPDASKLTGGGTSGLAITAQGFDKVSLVANQGGFDTADLYDTADNDRLDAAADWVRLYRNAGTLELLYEALSVERVRAHGSAGANTHNVTPPLACDLIFQGAWAA